jgi:hypothetical protein
MAGAKASHWHTRIALLEHAIKHVRVKFISLNAAFLL